MLGLALASAVLAGCCGSRSLTARSHRLLFGGEGNVQVRTLDELLAEAQFSGHPPVEAREMCTTAGSAVLLVRISGAEEPHRHTDHDLVVHVLSGHGTMQLEERVVHIGAGDIVVIERGTLHAYRNKARAGSLAVVVRSPGRGTSAAAAPH